ncbi:MAG: isocitrate lyase/PEP mutase family protein [Lachnospiraceae bacterium]|nr:isocitrate lyase/PEP mutase family protein [Lachnospiraceae bacterium]
MKREKINLRELMAREEIIIVPELYDCASARAAEINGFECIMLSSGDFACSMTGVPDLQLLSIDEFEWITQRITNAVSLPLIVDADDGFGFGRALNTWYACKRLAHAGAAGVLITDAAPQAKPGVQSVEEAVLRFKAARDGLNEINEEAVLIARCDVDPVTGLEEVIERSNRYVEAGADCICVVGLNKCPVEKKFELSKKLSEGIPGWHWFPDLSSHDGVPDVELEDIAKLRYKFVGVHYSMHAAMIAMLDTGKQVMETRNNVYVATHYEDTGFSCFSPVTFYLRDGYWQELEGRYVANPEDSLSKRITPFFVRETDRF